VKAFDSDKTRMTGLQYGEKNYDDMLSRFHMIPERHGQRDGQMDRIAISISRVSVLTCDKNRCWVVLGPALKKRDVNVGPMSGLSFANTTPTIHQQILVDGPTIRLSLGRPTLAQRSSADWVHKKLHVKQKHAMSV